MRAASQYDAHMTIEVLLMQAVLRNEKPPDTLVQYLQKQMKHGLDTIAYDH